MKSKITFKLHRTSRFDKNKEQVYGEAIQHLCDENNGRVNPRIVLDEAKRKSSPLHECFEWDDAVAGENWRLHTAGTLLCSIVVVEQKGQETRAFHNVFVPGRKGEEVRAYVTLDEMRNNPEVRTQALDTAVGYLKWFSKRYRHLNELDPVFDAIEHLAGADAEADHQETSASLPV